MINAFNWYIKVLKLTLKRKENSLFSSQYDYYSEAGLYHINKILRERNIRHYSNYLEYAFRFIKDKADFNNTVLIDLGCGSGITSLYFDRYIKLPIYCVEVDNIAIKLLEEQKNYLLPKNHKTIIKDIKTIDKIKISDKESSIAHLIIFSQFAFNMFTPHDELLKQIFSINKNSEQISLIIIDNRFSFWSIPKSIKKYIFGINQFGSPANFSYPNIAIKRNNNDKYFQKKQIIKFFEDRNYKLINKKIVYGPVIPKKLYLYLCWLEKIIQRFKKFFSISKLMILQFKKK